MTVVVTQNNITSPNANVTALTVGTANGLKFPNAGPLSNRNKIINGDMRIDQRNNGASITVTSANFPVDRWKCREFSDGTATGQRVTDVPNNQFTNSLKYTVGTADSSLTGTQFGDCQQVIEGNNISDLGWGTSDAQTITISFWVKSSAAGTYYVTPQNVNFNRSYPKSYTINSANTWEYKTLTIPGDTSGTWNTDNGVGIFLSWCVGTGPTYQGTANQWNAAGTIGASDQTNLLATSGATFYLTGVQLEVGSVATPFEHRSYGQELALCQRYYQGMDTRTESPAYHCFGTSHFTSAATAFAIMPFATEMRIRPTSIDASAANTFFLIGITNFTTITIDQVSRTSGVILFSGGSGGWTNYRSERWLSNNNNTAYCFFNAEL
jgi:hypothetical protein